MKIIGKAVIFGDNVNTDVIIPGKYLTTLDPCERSKPAMEGLDPNFWEKAREGVIIVAGKNFGCGSSREQAPIALKFACVGCILAEAFARIFFRNAINYGFPVLIAPGITNFCEEGDILIVNIITGEIQNLTTKKIMWGESLPEKSPPIQILKDGGILEKLKKELQ